MQQAVKCVFDVLPRRHEAPPPPLQDALDVYILEGGSDGLPLPITRRMAATPPTGRNSAQQFEPYMNEFRRQKQPAYEQDNVYYAYGRTRQGHSVMLVVPCPVSVCLELPDTFDGDTPLTAAQVEQFVTVVRLELESEVAAEYERSCEECNASGSQRNWRYPHAPTIDVKYAFEWRERSAGWQPARPEDPTCIDCLKVPVVKFTVKNNWAYSRLVQVLEHSVAVPGVAVPVGGVLWETKDQIKPDLRFRLEGDKMPAAGWIRVPTAKLQKPSWHMSHTDLEFFLEDMSGVQLLKDDTSLPPLCQLSVDIECKSGTKADYARLVELKLEPRFPKAVQADNHVTVIGIVIHTADKREVCVALELNDRPNQQQLLYSAHTVRDYDREYTFHRFLVPQERQMLLLFRDIMTYYDPDLVLTFNGDGFDWPYLAVRYGDPGDSVAAKRYYHMGRLIWTDWTRHGLWGFESGDVFKPVFGPNKPKGAVYKQLSLWKAGTFDQVSCTPQMSGRIPCDQMALFDGCMKGIGAFSFKNLNLDNVAARFLKYHKINLQGDNGAKVFAAWFGLWSKTATLEEQRLMFSRYCVWDAMLPILVMARRNIVSYVLKVAAITGARVSDVVNRGQLAKVGAMFVDVAWRRNYVVTWSQREQYEYEGAIVLTPQPRSLAGVDPETATLRETQDPPDPAYDWSPFIVGLDPSDDAKGATFQAPDVQTYDGETKTVACETVFQDGSRKVVRVPAQYHNDNFVVTLDFESLYPSVERQINMCLSTVYNPAEPYNAAELCALKIRAMRQADANDERMWELVQAALTARAEATFDYTVSDDSDEQIPLRGDKEGDIKSDSTTLPPAEDDLDIDTSEQERVHIEREPAATTDIYIKGDGDRTKDWPPHIRERCYVVQVSEPGKGRRAKKRVHTFVKPHVRLGIFKEIIDRCLNERKRHKLVLKGLAKLKNQYADITPEELAQATVLAAALDIKTVEMQNKIAMLADTVRLHGTTDKLQELVQEHPKFKEHEEEDGKNDNAQLAYKLTANSIYGGSGNKNPKSFLASPAVAESTTAVARQKIMFSKDTVLTFFRSKYPDTVNLDTAEPDADGLAGAVVNVLYGDTDSIFVHVRCRGHAMAMKFAKHIAAYINQCFKEQYGGTTAFNLQAECVKKNFVIFQMKNYRADQLDDGKEFWEEKEKGVATVRRDRPQVLTDLLSQIYGCISKFGNYPALVGRRMIMRLVWVYMEAMVENRLPIEKYHITQRIKTMPQSDTQQKKKVAQHIAVARRVQEQTGVPVRIGDSSTYVIVKPMAAKIKDCEAMPANEVKLEDVDRDYYWERRMWTDLQKALTPFVGADKVMRIFHIYKAALNRMPMTVAQMASTKSPGEYRWLQIEELFTSGRTYAKPAPNKRKQPLKTATLASFFKLTISLNESGC